MANAVNVNFRMDPDLKRSMEEVCAEMGLSMTTAFTIFAKKVSREHRIPFEVSADRFCQQAAVLGDFRCHQFPCPFDLVQVLHRSLRKATSIISARSSTTSIPEKPNSLSTI